MLLHFWMVLNAPRREANLGCHVTYQVSWAGLEPRISETQDPVVGRLLLLLLLR